MRSVVPEGWLKGQLSSIATLEYGKSPNHVRQEEGLYPIVGTSGIVGTANQYLWGEKSVVIGRKGTINKPIYIETPFWAIDTTYFCKFAEDTDPKWFYYKVCEEQLEKHNEASGVPSLSRETLRGLPIEIPPLPEQKKIASILTSVDEVIENTQKQIDKLQDLKKATMNELLTKGIGHAEFKDSELGRIPKSWEIYKVSDLLTNSKQKAQKNLPIYSVLMDGGMIPRTSVDRRVESNLSDEDNLFAPKDSLVYNMMRMWQGASGIAPVNCLVSPAYVVCLTTGLISSDFLGYLMKSEESVQKLRRYSQGITGDRMRLYFQHFQEIKFSIPPIGEQRKIAKIIDAVSVLLERKHKKLTQTQSLKKSLMQDLLTGKIRVTVN
ncbi:restriction endonuclease subunit S [Luminiphilus sp.]|nr:restriction endonuclease subunit S [Luminiphilus sp.]